MGEPSTHHCSNACAISHAFAVGRDCEEFTSRARGETVTTTPCEYVPKASSEEGGGGGDGGDGISCAAFEAARGTCSNGASMSVSRPLSSALSSLSLCCMADTVPDNTAGAVEEDDTVVCEGGWTEVVRIVSLDALARAFTGANTTLSADE